MNSKIVPKDRSFYTKIIIVLANTQSLKCQRSGNGYMARDCLRVLKPRLSKSGVTLNSDTWRVETQIYCRCRTNFLQLSDEVLEYVGIISQEYCTNTFSSSVRTNCEICILAKFDLCTIITFAYEDLYIIERK
jgi:hypothetical protein